MCIHSSGKAIAVPTLTAVFVGFNVLQVLGNKPCTFSPEENAMSILYSFSVATSEFPADLAMFLLAATLEEIGRVTILGSSYCCWYKVEHKM